MFSDARISIIQFNAITQFHITSALIFNFSDPRSAGRRPLSRISVFGAGISLSVT